MEAVILLDMDIHLGTDEIVLGQGSDDLLFQFTGCETFSLGAADEGDVDCALGRDREVDFLLLFATCIDCEGQDIPGADARLLHDA